MKSTNTATVLWWNKQTPQKNSGKIPDTGDLDVLPRGVVRGRRRGEGQLVGAELRVVREPLRLARCWAGSRGAWAGIQCFNTWPNSFFFYLENGLVFPNLRSRKLTEWCDMTPLSVIPAGRYPRDEGGGQQLHLRFGDHIPVLGALVYPIPNGQLATLRTESLEPGYYSRQNFFLFGLNELYPV